MLKLLMLLSALARADTDTFTPTATATSTSTATATSTATVTATRTASATPTATATVTNTPQEWTVCIGLTPVLVATAWPDRTRLDMTNLAGSSEAFYGDDRLSTANAPTLQARDTMIWGRFGGAVQEWWACVATGTACVSLRSYEN